MNYWGYGVFQSDHDLNIVRELSEDAGLPLWFPTQRDYVREMLDSGVLTRMFKKRQEMRPQPKTEICILGALAVQLGANIEKKHRALIKRCIRADNISFHDEAKAQLKQAFSGYKNGQPIVFAHLVVVPAPIPAYAHVQGLPMGVAPAQNGQVQVQVQTVAQPRAQLQPQAQARVYAQYLVQVQGPPTATVPRKRSYVDEQEEFEEIVRQVKKFKPENSVQAAEAFQRVRHDYLSDHKENILPITGAPSMQA